MANTIAQLAPYAPGLLFDLHLPFISIAQNGKETLAALLEEPP
jgi:hypothetical protein